MIMNARILNICLFFTPFLIVAALLAYLNRPKSIDVPEHINCLMEIKQFDDTTKGLVTGYNYHLLKAFAIEQGYDITIRMAGYDNEPDSVEMASADIVILPFSDSASTEGRLHTIPIDSLTVWSVGDEWKDWFPQMDGWVNDYMASERHDSLSALFLKTYDPYRRRSGQTYISPYDDLIRKYSEVIGWDWRMLSALVYQESHFRINVISRRGARGLMQIMPHTARTLGIDDLLDPEENIHAGVLCLERMAKHLTDIPDGNERMKFILASYNAGENRIRGCINYAREQGLEGTTWDEIVSVIPEIPDFKGVETTAYVQTVLSLYGEFLRICP